MSTDAERAPPNRRCVFPATLMLRHIGEGVIADRVTSALRDELADRTVRTSDLGGTASTLEFTDAICRRLAA